VSLLWCEVLVVAQVHDVLEHGRARRQVRRIPYRQSIPDQSRLDTVEERRFSAASGLQKRSWGFSLSREAAQEPSPHLALSPSKGHRPPVAKLADASLVWGLAHLCAGTTWAAPALLVLQSWAPPTWTRRLESSDTSVEVRVSRGNISCNHQHRCAPLQTSKGAAASVVVPHGKNQTWASQRFLLARSGNVFLHERGRLRRQRGTDLGRPRASCRAG
jgi:hypothetical protein